MTTINNNKKQKTILDFFTKKTNHNNVTNTKIVPVDKSNNFNVITIIDDTGNTTTAVNDKNNNDNDKINETKKILNDSVNIVSTNNNKRPLGSNDELKNVENSIIEINYIDENLCQSLFEELEIDDEKNCDLNSKEKIADDNYEEPKSKLMITDDKYSNFEKIFQEFRHIIQTVLKNPLNEHLFNEQDWKNIQDLTSLDGSIQVLFIRLYMRKHDWIRIANIKYPQLCDDNNGDHSKQLQILFKSGFILDRKFFINDDIFFLNYLIVHLS